ncbi:MAG TPA: hypothetical protein VFF63_00015 [Candidatus Babeliales bacterium]|nr:hypothetical protein [Candidatus Babeliales bacterium]
MQTMRREDSTVEATVGYAADERGGGVAYARVVGAHARRLLRLAFRAPQPPTERAIGYAALTAVCRALARRGVRDVCFLVEDPELVDEISTGRGIGERLVLPYVRLRCALNALTKFTVVRGASGELSQRARAEVALNVAA